MGARTIKNSPRDGVRRTTCSSGDLVWTGNSKEPDTYYVVGRPERPGAGYLHAQSHRQRRLAAGAGRRAGDASPAARSPASPRLPAVVISGDDHLERALWAGRRILR